jgi:hypothetical protein
MGGVLTHVSVALIGCLIVLAISRKWKFGIAFAIGQLAPDVIRWGVTALLDEKFSFREIILDSLFWKLGFTHYFYVWVIVFVLIFGLLQFLYKKKKIDKKQLKAWIIADAIMLLGIVVHLIIDANLMERSFWI